MSVSHQASLNAIAAISGAIDLLENDDDLRGMVTPYWFRHLVLLRLRRFLEETGVGDMPKPTKPNDPKDNGWKGFINIPFREDEKLKFKAWETAGDAIWELFDRMLLNGYKVSFTYDLQTSAYMIALTCGDKANENAGWTLTCRAPSMFDAIRLAMFKHYVLADESWTSYEDTERDQWG